MTFLKEKMIKVIDPDIDRPVDAWDQGVDEKTGERLVVLIDEPLAIRRIAEENVFSELKLVSGAAKPQP